MTNDVSLAYRCRRTLSQILGRVGYAVCRLNVHSNLKWLEETSRRPAREIEPWRLQKLGDLIEFCWDNVDFYREFWGDHGVKIRRIRDWSELQAFPVLRKDLFRKVTHRVQPRNVQAIRHIDKSTGGSTSEPVAYKQDYEQWALLEAFHIWNYQKIGCEYGDAVGVIAGGSLVPEKASARDIIRRFIQRRKFLYGVAMDRDMARRYVDELVAFNTRFIYGYPSVVYIFARHLQDMGITLPNIKGIVTTAEMMLPQYRKVMEEVFQCPVYNNYGSNDGGIESYECKNHSGFHYNPLQCYLEMEPAEEGKELGKLLITNLWNKSTPFIRYENGDLVTLTEETCSCGSSFPRIKAVHGRTADILTFANGKSVSGPALTLIFGDMKIDGWQIAQTTPKSLEVRLSGPKETCTDYEPQIRRVLNFHLNANSNDIDISVKHVDKLVLTRGGKLKPVIKEF